MDEVHASMAVGPRQIQRALKLRGLELRPAALKAIQSVLKREANSTSALDVLANAIKERVTLTRANPIVDEDLVKQAVLALSKNEEDEVFDSIKVIDAFSIPQSVYNSGTRSFQVLHQPGSRPLQAGPESKAQLLRHRLAAVHQRTMRNSLFKPQPQRRNKTQAGENEPIQLTPIEQLAAGGGDAAQLHHVLGVLTRVDEHQLWIEDANGKLALDLSSENMAAAPGFFTLGCVVIATGHLISLMDQEAEEAEDVLRSTSMVKHVFRVEALLQPPKEDRAASEAAHPGCARRLLGLPDLPHKDETRMREMELDAGDAFFVLLSDVHLDDPDTMASLRKVFQGFATEEEAGEPVPQLFVLMGNLSRKQFALSPANGEEFISPREFGDLLEALAVLLLETPSLLTARTRWVICPGPRDPSLAPQQILPRPSIPAALAKRFTSLLPAHTRVSFTTNPCRILFYQQELCLFRNDSVSQMRRNCVLNQQHDRNNGADEHLVRTICSQAHLCPIIDAKPYYLNYLESAMRLFPLPNLVVMADHYDQYQWNNDGCIVMNPGSFSSDGSFVVYLPAEAKIEFSRVPRGEREERES